MSHLMEFEFAKVCHADKPDTERDRLQSRRGYVDSLQAPKPMIFAKEEPHDDHHHHRL